MTDPHYTILFPTHPESSSLHRTETPLIEIEKLSTTLPTTLEEDRPKSRHSEVLLLVQLTGSKPNWLLFRKNSIRLLPAKSQHEE